ncbi:helix-turn-helix protein [Herbihabitans rhizosphaerae]|uniref:Helix-turn-helix protein n=1 Tax=Herbihabitans rhizosphaerae TaxID=1872711 RepID=A0A4Q7KGQ9_9PSEU|nr:helix-turn-helix transcriptional regulator [Herbihabitans rhizosphaerae]RZS32766.1 helix-turn-helix protein [Herbihabitans rhizosphaerae]
MAMTPTVRLKFLSIYMREARLKAGVTTKEVAKLLGRDTTRVAKFERGKEGLTPGDAKMLLDHYDVHSEQEKAEIVELARTRSQRGRWIGHRAVIPTEQRAFYDFETDANLIQHYGNELVPGLLQTEDYIRALLIDEPRVDPGSIDDVVAMRLERQRLLYRAEAAEAAFVLSESCLRRKIGGNKIMHEQMQHLAMLARRPNAQIQVLPFNSSGRASTFGFTMLRIPAPTASAPPLDMVYVENLHDADYLDDLDAVADYAALWRNLTASARSPESSRRFILEVARGYA